MLRYRLAKTSRCCAPAAARSARPRAGRVAPSLLAVIARAALGAQIAIDGQLKRVVGVAVCAPSCGSPAMGIRIFAAFAGKVRS